MSEMVHVYELTEPGTGEVRYVGASKDPTLRLEMITSDPHSKALESWISSIDDRPGLNIVGTFTEHQARKKEQELIRGGDGLLNSENAAPYPEIGEVPETKQIRVDDDTWKALNSMKKEPGETFDDVISRMLNGSNDDA